MNHTLIVTHINFNQKEYTVCGLFEKNRLLELWAEPHIISENQEKNNGILGNIYVGRVKDVVKNLNAAFIEIAPGLPCYYPLEELKNPIYVKKMNSSKLVQGDELLVQVVKEPIKTKPPRVSTNLNFTGKYMVLTSENQSLGISRKLSKECKERLKAIMNQYKSSDLGMIARTNCETATEEQILDELNKLQQQATDIINRAPYHTCFSCVLKQEPGFIKSLQNMYAKELEEIITDDKVLYDAMHEYLKNQQPEDLSKLRFYQDNMLSLSKCYSLEVKLKEALKEHVWLKTGGYLVIQPTEALTVIDVNSGKSMAKGDVQNHYLKVNLEAAEEIATQLRLRNISGIIIVDFIDMNSTESKQQLMETLRRYTRKDPVPVQVVDMTKLNLVELTRKKVRKSLAEQFT